MPIVLLNADLPFGASDMLASSRACKKIFHCQMMCCIGECADGVTVVDIVVRYQGVFFRESVGRKLVSRIWRTARW